MLVDAAERSGKQMAGGAGGYLKAMRSASASAKSATADQKALAKEIAKTEGALRRLEERQELARRKFEAAKEDAVAEAAGRFQDNTFGAGSLPWENDLQAAEQLAEDLNTKLREVGETFGEFEDTPAFRNLNVEIGYQREKLAELQAQLAEMKADTGVPVQAATDAAAALEQPVKVAEQELGRYMRLMSEWSDTMQEDSWSDAVINDENAMLSITRYINTAIHKREEEYRNTVAAIDNAKAAAKAEMDIHQYIGGLIEKREQQYQGVVRQIEEAAAATETVEQESTATVRTMDELGASSLTFMDRWQQMPTMTGMISNAFRGVKDNAVDSFRQIVTAAQGAAENAASVFNMSMNHPLQAVNRGLAAIVSGAGRALASVGKLAGGGAVRYLRTLASTAKNAGIQLAKMAGSAVKGGLKKVGGFLANATKSLLSFHKTQGTTNAGMGLSLKNLLRYGLGIRSLFALFNRLRSAAKDGLEAIAKRSPATRSALNGLKASLSGLKGSLATAFAPIFTAVAPALTTLVNMLTTAINAIGAFMAALTGQKTYQKAVAGLKATGSAASGASGEVKDLKRELAGFDHLEILGDKNSGSGGGGGSSGGSGLTYDTEQVGGGIADWVEQLKTLWAAQDYDGIGRVIADGINGAFEKAKQLISWDNLGEKVTQAVNAITGILNGLVDGINWDLIGRTFGTGVNTILNAMNQLLTKIDWANLGKKLAEGLNGLVDEVDWALLGDTLGARFKAALQALGNFLATFDWGALGTKLSTGINALVKKINEAVDGVNWNSVGTNIGTGLSNLITGVDWETVGATLAKYFNTALTVIQTTIQNFKFGEAGTALGDGVNKFIQDVDWTGIGQTILDAFAGALEFIAKAIEAIDWKQIGKDLVTAAKKLDLSGLYSSVSEAIGAALGGLAAFIAGVINEAFKGIKNYFDKSIEEAGGDVVLGILNGIINAIAGLGAWIVDNIFKPFIDGFKKAFGIASPAKEMEEPGKNILLGVYEGIKAAIKGVGQWVKKNIFDPIWDAIKNAGETAITIAVSLVKKIGDWAADVWNFLVSGVETIARTIKAGIEWATTVAESIITWLAKGLETVVKTVQAGLVWATKIAETIFKWLEKGLETIVKTVQAGLVWASKIAETIFKWLEKGLETIVKTVQAGLVWATKIAETIFKWLEKGLETIVKTVQAGLVWASKIAETIFKWLEKGLETIVKTVKAGLVWVSELIGTIIQWIAKGVETIAKTVKAGLIWATKIAETIIQWIAAGLETIVKTVKAGLGWNSNTAEAIWGFISGAGTITKDIIVNIIGNIDSWLASFLGINTSGESKKIAAEDGGAMAYAQSHGVNVTATVNGKAGTGIKSLGDKNKLNDFSSASQKINGKAGTGIDSLGDKNKLNGFSSASQKINGKAGTGIDSLGSTNKLNSFGAVSEKINATAGTGIKSLGSTNKLNGFADQTVKVGVEVDRNKNTVEIKPVAGSSGKWVAQTKALGGIITAAGRSLAFASGGLLSGGGRPRWWNSVQKYASGTTRAHGSMFVAGEAGPEIIGHINGRTEILNKSQLAQTMYSAVSAGMLAALSKVRFRMPAMATGAVLPYEIAAQIARTGEAIEDTLNANNEDLIQVIISTIGAQTSALVAALQALRASGEGGVNAQQVIEEINRRTQMFGASPIMN